VGHGWSVAPEHVYVDDGISGALFGANRPGLARLLLALSPTDTARTRDLLVRLALTLGGDRSAAEPARMLRVPGTLNHKPEYETPRPVVLEFCEPERRYTPSELEEWLPAAPEPGGANGAGSRPSHRSASGTATGTVSPPRPALGRTGDHTPSGIFEV
jgi:hypothetical protein